MAFSQEEFELLVAKELTGEATEKERGELRQMLSDPEQGAAFQAEYDGLKEAYAFSGAAAALTQEQPEKSGVSLPRYAKARLDSVVRESFHGGDPWKKPASTGSRSWFPVWSWALGMTAVAVFFVSTQFSRPPRVQFADFELPAVRGDSRPATGLEHVDATYFPPSESVAFDAWQAAPLESGVDAKVWLDRETDQLVVVTKENGPENPERLDLPRDPGEWSRFVRTRLEGLLDGGNRLPTE